MVYLTDLADTLRDVGLSVVEIPGWRTRGRPGSFAPVGVLCHHTGSANTGLAKEYGYANWLATVGRSDLAAPLAQLALGRTGVYYVLAAGRANHAGRCKLIAGLQPSYPGAGYGDGNTQLIGIEAMNSGSEGWSTAQHSAYVRGCAALNARYGFPVTRTLGHKETSLSGKPDPGGIDMAAFRRNVAAVDITQPIGENDMPTLEELAPVIRHNVLGALADMTVADTAAKRQARDAVRTIVRDELATLILPEVDPERLAAALVPLLPDGNVTTEQLVDAMRQLLGGLDEGGAAAHPAEATS